MPIYEYECPKCGSTFELMQSVNAAPPKTCMQEKCKGKPRRLVSASGFILKGSGWYVTDYPSEARKKGWESEGKKATSPDSTAPATGGGGAASAPGKTETPSAPAAPASASKPAAPKVKNPYTGGSKSKNKAPARSSIK